MKYHEFAIILNQALFIGSKEKLITSVARSPQRFTGLFRPTKPRAKLIQNLLQSQEIRLGDAFEKIIEGYLKENECVLKNKSVEIGGITKNIDLYFSQGGNIFVIEQKMRDDHDSSKKRGQMADLKSKVEFAIRAHSCSNIRGGIFFVDASLTKNKKFYKAELEAIMNIHKKVHLDVWYGQDFFIDVFGGVACWNEMLSHLYKWKGSIPDFPEINFDNDSEANFNEIKDVLPSDWNKIFDNNEVREEILPILFPKDKVLRKLGEYYSQIDGYTNVCRKIKSYIDNR